MYIYLRPGTTVVPPAKELSQEALTAAVKRAYPNLTVGRVQSNAASRICQLTSG